MSIPTGPIQPTRVQIEVFELRCPSDRLARLDMTRLAEGNPPNGEVVKRLGALGAARLLARVDNTIDLLTESTLSRTAKVPVVQDVTVAASGPAVPSINYQSMGLTMTLNGSWEADGPDQAVIQCKLDLSSLAGSSVQVASGVEMPAFVKLSISRNLVAHSGKPVWALSNNLPASADEKGMTSAAVARLLFTRLSPLADPEPTDDQKQGASSPDEQARNVSLQIDVFELICTDEQLAGLSLDDVSRDDPADGAVLSRLAKSGEAKLLSRTLNSFDMSTQNRLAHGARLPIVSDLVTASDGTTAPSISYNNVTSVAGIVGRWHAAATPWADARIEISGSVVNQSRIKRSSGVPLTSFDEFGLRQRIGTPSGRAVWSMSSNLPDSADDRGRTNVIILRVKPTSLPRPTLSEAEAEQAAEAPFQEQKPQPARVCVELFDLACTHEQLADLDLAGITADEPTADAVLERLRPHGKTRLLARVEDAADLRSGLSLSQSIQMPQVQDMIVSQGSVKPKISYRDLGLKASFNGRWLPGSGSWADLDCKLAITMDAQSHVNLPSGVTVPTFVDFSVDQRQLLESGKSMWVISNRLPQPDDPAGTVNVKIMRLRASREDGPLSR